MARIFLLSLILAGIVSLIDGFAPRAALAGPNVPLCLAMQNNYNECVRHERARERERRRYEEYEDEWGRGPHGRRRHSDCGAWLVQLKAQGCF
ncbi:hypothetical protein [Methylosinus sp. LW4]|uniref:hypothetical protein n=1 Tax=Methylosinus sp. LW4 TaxID=136993 RepID=UPI00036A50B3|nr:hypothetical protein [Methylosinus sp. LW4]